MTSPRTRWWLTPALCVLLAIAHTWPLASAPGTLSRNDNGDAQLNEWIMAWVAHQLPRSPARLFNANIFYPASDTLAFSEPLIVPALMGAPLRWLGASPVLVFNVVLIAGFALSAWAMAALIVSWTADRAAGLLAGSMFAFNTHTLTRLAHIQGIHTWGLPLALLAADRIITRTLVRDAIWLAVWMSAMAYTSGYLLVFGSVMIAVVLVARAADWVRRPARVLSSFALSAALATVVSLPVYIPYHRVARDQGMVRSLANVAEYSATLTGYLASAGRHPFLHVERRVLPRPRGLLFSRCHRAGARRARALAVASSSRTGGHVTRHITTRADVGGNRGRRIRPVARHAHAGLRVVVPRVPPDAGPACGGAIRQPVPPRNGRPCWPGPGRPDEAAARASRDARGIVLVAAANVESLRAPFPYTRFEGIPGIYSILAEEPGRVVLAETPFYPPQAVFENAAYVLASTAHWRPLMNGYSGYVPGSYRTYAASFWFFPEDFAIQEMRKAGVTHVMVHPQRFYQDAGTVMQKVSASPFLERIAIGRNGDALYRLK